LKKLTIFTAFLTTFSLPVFAQNQQEGANTGSYTENLGVSLLVDGRETFLSKKTTKENVYEAYFMAELFEIIFSNFVHVIEDGSHISLLATTSVIPELGQAKSFWLPIHKNEFYSDGCAVAEKQIPDHMSISKYLSVNTNEEICNDWHYWWVDEESGRLIKKVNGNLSKPIERLLVSSCPERVSCKKADDTTNLFQVSVISPLYLYIFIDLNNNELIDFEEIDIIVIRNSALLS